MSQTTQFTLRQDESSIYIERTHKTGVEREGYSKQESHNKVLERYDFSRVVDGHYLIEATRSPDDAHGDTSSRTEGVAHSREEAITKAHALAKDSAGILAEGNLENILDKTELAHTSLIT